MDKATNRFYYSEKQATLWGQNDANKVFDGKHWVQYSEWISKEFMNETCNWDDAVLVFETEDDFPPIQVNPNRHSVFDDILDDLIM